MRRALEDLLVSTLVSLHGLSEDRTITAEDLMAHKFDPAQPRPDELDYL